MGSYKEKERNWGSQNDQFPAMQFCCMINNLPSKLLISLGPKPVAVRVCFGREMPAGPTAPWISTIGADVEGRLSRVGRRCCSDAIASVGNLVSQII